MHFTPIFVQIANVTGQFLKKKEPDLRVWDERNYMRSNTELSQILENTQQNHIVKYCAPTLPIDLCRI